MDVDMDMEARSKQARKRKRDHYLTEKEAGETSDN